MVQLLTVAEAASESGEIRRITPEFQA